MSRPRVLLACTTHYLLTPCLRFIIFRRSNCLFCDDQVDVMTFCSCMWLDYYQREKVSCRVQIPASTCCATASKDRARKRSAVETQVEGIPGAVYDRDTAFLIQTRLQCFGGGGYSKAVRFCPLLTGKLQISPHLTE